MRLTSGRAAIVALLFLGAQAAPGLHAALEPAHEIHSCCPDGMAQVHFDACEEDHDAPHCPVCATARTPASMAPQPATLRVDRTPVSESSAPESIPFDPLHVDLPDSRGPPD
ncbi:MAG TPA: hypothetical protein VJU16_09310 [Planctomycetota bacterium]|nr:hypothetical protein [Planctomycetota bacterium]